MSSYDSSKAEGAEARGGSLALADTGVSPPVGSGEGPDTEGAGAVATTAIPSARRRLLVVGFGVAVFGLWELGAAVGILHPLIVPAPSDIIATIPEVVGAEYFLPNVRITFFEILAGFVLAAVIALALAILVARWEAARVTIYPYIIAVQSVPKIVFTPIFITWFGFGPSSKVVNAIVIAFFPLFINAMAGLMQVDRDAVRLLRSLTASQRQVFMKLLLPGAMPQILTGVRLCWTNAVIGVIVAEFIGASAGIGYLITLFNFQLQIARVFVLILMLSIFTVTVYKLIEAIEKRVCSWAYEGHAG